MGAEHVVAGVVAFSLTKKLIVLGTVNWYGVGRLYRHGLKLAQRTTQSTANNAGMQVWRTPAADGFKVRRRRICERLMLATLI